MSVSHRPVPTLHAMRRNLYTPCTTLRTLCSALLFVFPFMFMHHLVFVVRSLSRMTANLNPFSEAAGHPRAAAESPVSSSASWCSRSGCLRRALELVSVRAWVRSSQT